MDTISRQDAIAAVNRYARQCDAVFVIDEINALPALECKQCSDLVRQINGLKDALAQAEGVIADLRSGIQA